MHRYCLDTLLVILNRYLREFLGNLEGRKHYFKRTEVSASAYSSEKIAASEELRVLEGEILCSLAAPGIEIDLDDGVKVKYAKFGNALVVIK